MPIYLGAEESPLDEFRRRQRAVKRGALEPSDAAADRGLFGGELAIPGEKKSRARQQVTWCAKCNRLDSVFWGGGVSVTSVRCVHCGGEVVTGRARSAKLKFYDAIMDRCRRLVMLASYEGGDVDEAVSYAEYAAHTAFKLKLVPYGPEPKR
jgi:hypothetical protein